MSTQTYYNCLFIENHTYSEAMNALNKEEEALKEMATQVAEQVLGEPPVTPDYLSQWAPRDTSHEWKTVNNKMKMPRHKNKKQNLRDKAESCDTFQKSKEYAKKLDPSAQLDYIPMEERKKCKWMGEITLQCPKRGLLRWIGSIPPKSPEEMQTTKFFVCRGNVGESVEAVVTAPRTKNKNDAANWAWTTSQEEGDAWMVSINELKNLAEEKIQEWKQKVPEGMQGYVDGYSPGDVINLILDQVMGERDLCDWLRWRDSTRKQRTKTGRRVECH